MRIILENPSNFYLIDASGNDRVAHIFFSLKGALDNFLLPNGFNNWTQYVNSESARNQTFFYVSSGRIMSTYGAALYELGVFGLILPVSINIILFRLDIRSRFAIIITINLLLFTAIPLAFPILSIFLGYIYYMIKNEYECC